MATTAHPSPSPQVSPRMGGFKKLFGRRTSSGGSSSGGKVAEEPVKDKRRSNSKRRALLPPTSSAKKDPPSSSRGSSPQGIPPKASSRPTSPVVSASSSPSRNKSPTLSNKSDDVKNNGKTRESLFQWQDQMWERERREKLTQKQLVKERDGFCRRVDVYDGQVISVEGQPAYELGNYLGGGVAGVVYEGHRLRPMEDYPVRLGQHDVIGGNGTPKVVNTVVNTTTNTIDLVNVASILTCGASLMGGDIGDFDQAALVANATASPQNNMTVRDGSLLTVDSQMEMPPPPGAPGGGGGNDSVYTSGRTAQRQYTEDMALEATESQDQMVIIDTVDAPSRSKHYAKAIMHNQDLDENNFPSDASISYGIMEETVAIKVLNPVGFRTMAPEVTRDAVIAREGAPLTKDVANGVQPMEERHVWWLVNPNSRNLRTLQRYADNGGPARRVEIDRGSPEKGLRISLIAAYKDPKTRTLRELPLTRCIEIWGHVSFGATDQEFNSLMSAIDRINQGQPPPPVEAFGDGGQVPGRIGTGGTASSGNNSETMSLESLKISSPMSTKRTGIYRAASTSRMTVFCEELKAYIALPPVPSKYLKWLKQRRAATKEIRNMMLIGRHRNVVHLFEVLELIQENKSTMFLILELVRGGELFDLISSNTAKISSSDKIPPRFTETETVMRKFFQELASGVHYCHSNGIAHRDLKPENLLVHNRRDGKCELKIADFGLSAAFGPSLQQQNDQDTVIESIVSPPGSPTGSPRSYYGDNQSLIDDGGPPVPATIGEDSPLKQKMDKFLSTILNCGSVDDIINCRPRTYNFFEQDDSGPSPLKRMTSVVGSPHYVAPEIISQNEHKRNRKKATNDGASLVSNGTLTKPVGYDGTRADVWSAGVILYAMLFRSLPFGEDLLRCPRYQSFKKWYDEIKDRPGRRMNAHAALNPVFTDQDERDFLGPHWFFPSETSPESRDLIVAMLNPNPDLRPTIEMVLRHPWLLKQAV